MRVSDSATTTNIAGIQIAGGSTGSSEVVFAAENDASNASISCDNNGDDLTIAAEDDIAINATGDVIVNDAGVDSDFRIEGQNDNNIFYVDAGNDRMGVSTATPNSTLEVEGSLALYTVTESSTGNLTTNACIVLCNNSSAFEIDLPSASGLAGRVIFFIITDPNDTDDVTLEPNGGETIDGAADLTLGGDSGEIYRASIVSDGSNWYTLSYTKK